MVTDSILNPEYHGRLIQDIEGVAERANIPVHLIHQSSEHYLLKREVEWLKDIKHQHLVNSYGMVVTGKVSVSVQIKFMAMAAMLLRNYVEATVITLTDMLAKPIVNPTVLLVPNFYTCSEGKPLSSWQIQEIQSVLTRRIVECKPTVLYVQDGTMMRQHYGEAVYDLLSKNYSTYKEK